MLLSFSVENYKSLLTKQTFTMEVPKSNDVLNTSVIYGSNASGKSNLLEAMADVKKIIVDPDYTLWPPVFSKINHGDNKISKFEFKFRVGEHDTYLYKLSVHTGVESQPRGFTIVSEEAWDVTNPKNILAVFEPYKSNVQKKEDIKWEDYADLKNRSSDLRKEYEKSISEIENLEKLRNTQVNLKDDIEHGSSNGTLVYDWVNTPNTNKRDWKSGPYLSIESNFEKRLSIPNWLESFENFEKQNLLKECDDKIKAIDDQRSQLNKKIGELGKLIEESDKELSTYEKKIRDTSGDKEHYCRLYEYAKDLYHDEHVTDINKKRIKDMYNWFSDILTIIFPDDHIFVPDDDDYFSELSEIIDNFDVGISKIKFKEIDVEEQEEVKRSLSEYDKDRMDISFKVSSSKDVKMSFVTKTLSGLYQFLFKHGRVNVKKVVAMHSEAHESEFDLSDESDGTMRLIEIASILLNNNDDKVYIVDELDRRMHPLLTAHIVEEFMIGSNERKQLIFTSHEHTILKDMFDPEEVWTVSRSCNASSLKRSSTVKGINKRCQRMDQLFLEGKIGGTPKFTE